jgi:hypothetical protein
LLTITGGHPSHGNGFFQHWVAHPRAVPLARAGPVRLGPVIASVRTLQLEVPSRTRVGRCVTVSLDRIDCTVPTAAIELPDCAPVLLKGRVVLPDDVPTARIAVVAKRRDRDPFGTPFDAAVAGIDVAGHFEIDVPQGTYLLQVVDLATTIAFHTEPDDVAVDGSSELLIRPALHWLTVACAPSAPGGEVVVSAFRVTLDAPRDGVAPTALGLDGLGHTATVPVAAGSTSARWLVPRGTARVDAMQSFAALRPGAADSAAQRAATATIVVERPAHRVDLVVPLPPSDEELERPRR